VTAIVKASRIAVIEETKIELQLAFIPDFPKL
jgi:hypothetical protein